MGKRTSTDVTSLLKHLIGRGGSPNRLLPPDFLETVIKEVGGAHAFAGQVALLITGPGTPQMVKARLISDLMRVMAQVEAKHGQPVPLDTLPTEDLQDALGDTMQKLGLVHAGEESQEEGGVGRSQPDSTGPAPAGPTRQDYAEHPGDGAGI